MNCHAVARLCLCHAGTTILNDPSVLVSWDEREPHLREDPLTNSEVISAEACADDFNKCFPCAWLWFGPIG